MEWIKCSDRMPNSNTSVICCFEDNVFEGYWEDRIYKRVTWYSSEHETQYNDPVFWMPLPTPPK